MGKCLHSGCNKPAIDGALYCREHESHELATELRVGGDFFDTGRDVSIDTLNDVIEVERDSLRGLGDLKKST